MTSIPSALRGAPSEVPKVARMERIAKEVEARMLGSCQMDGVNMRNWCGDPAIVVLNDVFALRLGFGVPGAGMQSWSRELS